MYAFAHVDNSGRPLTLGYMALDSVTQLNLSLSKCHGSNLNSPPNSCITNINVDLNCLGNQNVIHL